MPIKKLYPVRPIRDLKDMLDTSAAQFGDAPLFHYKPDPEGSYQPISFTTLKESVDRLGTALLGLGLKGKMIALIGEHRFEWAVSYLGVVNGVGIIVPLDKELPPHEIRNMLERSEAAAVICSGKLAEKVEEALQGNTSMKYLVNMDTEEDAWNRLSFKKLLRTGRYMMEDGNRDFLDAEIDPTAMSILLFTSATTSTSKAAMLSHRNIASNMEAVCRIIDINSADVMLSVLPIHHTYECTCGFLINVYRGSSVAFCDGLRYIAKNMTEIHPTIMLCVPLMLENMYKKIWDSAKKSGQEHKLQTALKISNFLRKFGIDLRRKLFAKVVANFGGRIRLMISGAAAVDPVIMKGLRDLGLPAVQGYGLTECSPILTGNQEDNFQDASAGLPLPGVEIRIDQPNEAGIGEIVARGENIMLGYYKDDEANRKAFDQGWFHTGDLGCFDKDGFLYITGRKKNVIITKNGKNVYPEEIEMLLNKSPLIKESLVYAKDTPGDDDITLAARIVPEMEAVQEVLGTAEPTTEQVRDLIWKEVKETNKLLVTYKYIKEIVIQEEEFQKTTTKKIKRYVELKDS